MSGLDVMTFAFPGAPHEQFPTNANDSRKQHLTKPTTSSDSCLRRNQGAISKILHDLQDLLESKVREGHHGEIHLAVKIAGNDIGEFSIGSMARSILK